MPFQDMTPCLLYADDALFFVKPETQQLQSLQIMLMVFGKVSGLTVNLAKSELLISQGTQEEQQDLANILGCKLGSFPFTYLGLPLSNKRLPRSAFLPLIQRMSTRLAGWAAKHLSIAGRIVLINSILTSIPTYYMTCLKMPKWVFNKMDKIRRTFLWHGASSESKSMSLINWSIVCTPKEHGGLGIIDLENFNQALLLKWVWQWGRPEKTLWKPLMQHRITPQTLLPDVPLFTKETKPFMPFCCMSFQYKPGNGRKISLWHHNWGNGILRLELQNLFTHAGDPHITLAEAKHATTIQQLFTHRLTDMACEELEILQQKLVQVTLNRLQEDGIQWQWSDTGLYTVKSAYQRLKDGPRIQTSIHRIWKLQVPPRMKVFGWLLIRNKLLTVDNLKKKGFQLVNRCTLCKENQETARHLFNYCPFSRALYEEMARTIPEKIAVVNATSSKTKVLTKTRVAIGQRSALLMTFFILWRERCARIFTEGSKGIEELKSEILWQMQFFEARSHRTTTP